MVEQKARSGPVTVTATASYASGDDVTMTADDAAHAILLALGLDPAVDACTISFTVIEFGKAGV